VADRDWLDPLDASFAEHSGGRWNPPGSFRTLYLNADVATARLQVAAMLDGQPVRVEDLDDAAYVLVAATLPRGQTCAEAVTDGGLRALGLPASYPLDEGGKPLPRASCRSIGAKLRGGGLRGVLCRSASTADGRGRELAWFPATIRSRAHPVWNEPLELGAWRGAADWRDLGLDEQPAVP
jgi:hypothetical protein